MWVQYNHRMWCSFRNNSEYLMNNDGHSWKVENEPCKRESCILSTNWIFMFEVIGVCVWFRESDVHENPCQVERFLWVNMTLSVVKTLERWWGMKIEEWMHGRRCDELAYVGLNHKVFTINAWHNVSHFMFIILFSYSNYSVKSE